jgi:hypothetical protein
VIRVFQPHKNSRHLSFQNLPMAKDENQREFKGVSEKKSNEEITVTGGYPGFFECLCVDSGLFELSKAGAESEFPGSA